VKRYIIERQIPGVETLAGNDLRGAAGASNDALAKLAPRVQWEHSYVTHDKTFCIYLADNEAVIQEHAKLSGFPANRITEVVRIIDPTTANA
jgi:hypothetical protein